MRGATWLVALVALVAPVAAVAPWYADPPLLPVLVAASPHMPAGQCRNHSRLFVRHLDNLTLWAVQMLDASAKLPGGLVDGDAHELGHFDECLAVSWGEVRGQYCLLELRLEPRRYPGDTRPGDAPDPYGLHFHPGLHVWEKLKATPDRTKTRRDTLHMALCLPASCATASLQRALDGEARDFGARTGLQLSARAVPGRCSTARPPPPFTIGETVYTAVLAVLVLIVVASTFYDCTYYLDEKESEAGEGSNSVVTLERALLCFSAKRSLHGLTKMVPYHEGLDAIDGIRFYFMMLVICGHRLSMFNSMPTLEANQFEQFFHKVATGFLLNGTLLVDFFFLVSGALLTYHLLLYMEKSFKVNLFAILVIRILRLTPSYILVVFFHATIFYRLGSGPLWHEVIGLDQQRCAESWWTNLLYINNYINVDKMCLYQSWYLSVDTQMFVVCLVLVYCIARWPRWGYSVLALLGVVSVVVPFLTTWWKRADGFLVPYPDTTNDVIASRYFQEIYIRTENRMAPSLIGIMLGIILNKTRDSAFRLNIWQSVASYAACFVLMAASFMTSYFFHKPGLRYDPVYAGLYASLSRVGLALCFAGLALCATFASWKLPQRLFSWRPLRVMSRLTYGAYLLHTISHFLDKGTRRVSQQSTVYAGLWKLLSDVTFSYLASFLLMLLLESPIRSLEKMVFRRAKPSS
ncbi:nose resistant to fluoxetine protein 6-like [Bacillus rossius redtenbacheri]|uniref:nose resistant to fluoxetine protein 6-like n=1 Tax=Bacillus rossius redtenbacheri TaxID=93214 RepID=UPI002FDD9E70